MTSKVTKSLLCTLQCTACWCYNHVEALYEGREAGVVAVPVDSYYPTDACMVLRKRPGYAASGTSEQGTPVIAP